MMNIKQVRVVIADAEPIWRLGLREVVERQALMVVVAEAGSVAEARAACEKEQPELLLLDVGLEGGQAFFFLEELPRWSRGTRVVVFTRQMDGRLVQRALRAGACGVFAKCDPIVSLLVGLHGATSGTRHLGPTAEGLLYERIAHGALELHGSEEAALSERELQIYRLMAEGRSTRWIAEMLSLSVKTVETHHARMKEKLGARTSGELRQRATTWASVEIHES